MGRLAFPGGIADLRRAIAAARGGYDVVQVFDFYYGLPAAYLARAGPRVLRLGTDPREEMGGRYGPGARAMLALAMPSLMQGAHLVVNSGDLASRFKVYGPRVIPNGLDFQRFQRLPPRLEARQALDLPRDDPLLLYVGKVIPAKRLEWLLEALRNLPDTRAVIVGGVNEEHYGDAYFRSLVEEFAGLRERLIFTGELPWDRVLGYYAACDIFAFPSSFEGMPNAVLEAMAAGLPVVASDIPAHQGLIHEGVNGFLVRDPGSMARVIQGLLKDETQRARIGSNAREFIKAEMTLEKASQRYLELYRSLVG